MSNRSQDPVAAVSQDDGLDDEVLAELQAFGGRSRRAADVARALRSSDPLATLASLSRLVADGRAVRVSDGCYRVAAE